jgi:hypothetical protein
MAQLERMLKALEAYRTAASPQATGAAGDGTGGQSVTRQLDEQAAPPPAAPAAAPTEAAP